MLRLHSSSRPVSIGIVATVRGVVVVVVTVRGVVVVVVTVRGVVASFVTVRGVVVVIAVVAVLQIWLVMYLQGRLRDRSIGFAVLDFSRCQVSG